MGAMLSNSANSACFSPPKSSSSQSTDLSKAFPDYLQLRQRLSAVESRLQAPEPAVQPSNPPIDSMEDPGLSPIDACMQPFPGKFSAENRVISHGKPKNDSRNKRNIGLKPVSVSPKKRSELLQASTHLFDFANRLIEEKERFLLHRKREEMRILKAKEELIREKMNKSKGGMRTKTESLPVSPTHIHAKAIPDDITELVSQAEQRVKLLNGEAAIETTEVSKELRPRVQGIRKITVKGASCTPGNKTQRKRPGVVHIDLGSASKLKSHRERSYQRRLTSDSPSKVSEGKDLLVLLQDSDWQEESPKSRQRQ